MVDVAVDVAVAVCNVADRLDDNVCSIAPASETAVVSIAMAGIILAFGLYIVWVRVSFHPPKLQTDVGVGFCYWLLLLLLFLHASHDE